MAFSFFVLYDTGSVAIHDESGGVLETVAIPDYESGTGPLVISSKIASNGDTIVIANLNTIITKHADNYTTYNITGCSAFNAAAPVSLSYHGGKYHLLVTNNERDPCSGSWGAGNFIYLESSDGIVWSELFDFRNDTVLGDYLYYPEVSYNSVDGYYYIVNAGFWGGDIYRTTDFISFSLFAAKPTSRRVAYPPVYEGTYVWYTQQYSSNALYLREIVKRSGSGSTTYTVSGVPGTINTDNLQDLFGVLLDADGTPYLYLAESDSIAGSQTTAYFFNGTSFARDATTTTADNYISFSRLKPLEYAISGGSGVVLSLVDTPTGYTDPYSIAVRKVGADPLVVAFAGYPIDVSLNGDYTFSDEFWSEEVKALETAYTY